MATGVLGLGSGASTGLTQDYIDKMKAVEVKAKVDPYTTKLTSWDKELVKVTEIETKASELLASIKAFDLFSSTTNAFEQVSASTTGTSAAFNANVTKGITEGTTTVNITKLAQKDVYQSDTFADKSVQVANGNDTGDKISIQVGTATAIEFSTVGKTYQQLADDINAATGIAASVEQVGTNSYRVVIKSENSGTANALTITQTGVDVGFATTSNHTLTAQNLEASVDGVAYNVSSNTITLSGNLTMTAVATGISSIAIQKDTSNIITDLTTFVTKYNELVDLVDGDVLSKDGVLEDTASIKGMLNAIKSILFDTYGDSEEENLFNYGFELDTTGHLTLNSTTLGSAISDNFDKLKTLFLGKAENKGLGTTLKEYMDDIKTSDGVLGLYGVSMGDRKTKLEDEKVKAQATIDAKYSLLAQQFAAYTAIITQMENSFGGLKMMIQQSTSSN